MQKLKLFVAAAALCASLLLCTTAQAQVSIQWVGAGSSALFNAIGLAGEANPSACNLFNDAASWTYANGADITDHRHASIPVEKGNIVVVWDPHLLPNTRVCIYVQVDSVVGNRVALGTDTNGNPATISIDPAAGNCSTTIAGQNIIPYLPYGADSPLPTAVCSAINNGGAGTFIQFAGSDIRPEDAAYATYRATTAYQGSLQPVGTILWGPNLQGLGYCNSPSTGPVQANTLCQTGSTTDGSILGIGEQIVSQHNTAKKATPILYSLFGNDPISGHAVGSYFTLNVGVGPIMVIANKTDTAVGGLGGGHFTNINSPTLAKLFDGTLNLSSQLISDPAVVGHGVPVVAWLREPLSGTMNTTEFSLFATNQSQTSQETNVKPVTAGGTDNPLNQTSRKRAVGTGDEVAAVNATTDSIGYAFWGYANLACSGVACPNLEYMTVNNIDPIVESGANPNGIGVIPVQNDPKCGSGYTCDPNSHFPILTFPNVQDGSYPAWTTFRIVGNHLASLTQLQQLIAGAEAQAAVYSDFLPITSAYAEHDHFYQNQSGGFSCGDASDGSSALAGGAGGDMGGLVFPKAVLSGTSPESTCPTETIRNLHQ